MKLSDAIETGREMVPEGHKGFLFDSHVQPTKACALGCAFLAGGLDRDHPMYRYQMLAKWPALGNVIDVPLLPERGVSLWQQISVANDDWEYPTRQIVTALRAVGL